LSEELGEELRFHHELLARDAWSAAMVAAFKRDPASVARYYNDDARLPPLLRRQGSSRVDP